MYTGYVQRYRAKSEHVQVAARALGKPIPAGAVVHHRNGNKRDNRPENLVICQDTAYHALLHYRLKAYRATGDANAVRCRYCGAWTDRRDPALYWAKSTSERFNLWHKTCARAAQRIIENARACVVCGGRATRRPRCRTCAQRQRRSHEAA